MISLGILCPKEFFKANKKAPISLLVKQCFGNKVYVIIVYVCDHTCTCDLFHYLFPIFLRL